MLKVGLLGCGTMGGVHSRAYEKMSDVEVVATCDIRKDFAEKLAEKHDAKVYEDFETMLASEEIDMIDLCLPTYLHHAYGIAAMRAGKDVFCEKPIALSLQEAQEMIQVAKEENVKFSVGHVLRFFPTYHRAASHFTEDQLGQARLIRTVRNQAYPMWSWDQWFSDYDRSGGPYVDLMIHDLDWIIHEFGPVERVYARSQIRKQQDHSIALMKLENGAIVHSEASWAYPQGAAFKMAFEIVGTYGQLEYDNQKDASIEVQVHDDIFKHSSSSPDASYEEPYYAELRAFIEHILYGKELVVTAEQAYESLRLALAAKKSAETGQVVELREVE